jgi:hypothetical protein
MNAFARLAGASLLGLAALPATAANLIVNGSFEDAIGSVIGGEVNWSIQDNPLPNDPVNGIWYTQASGTSFGTPGIEVQTNPTLSTIDAHSGTHYVELDGNPSPGQSSIVQYFATIPNQQYQFSFWYSPRTGNAASNDVFVQFGSLPFVGEDSFDGTGFTVGTWSLITYFFTATEEQSIVAFFSGPDSDTLGALIDDVSVTAVPVPAAVWLLGSAMVGLVGVSRRRSV